MIKMKKTILSAALALMSVYSVHAQKLFYTRNGHIDFFSSTAMENIKADNDKVSSVINITTGDLEFSVLNMAFQFEKALMQEHFNENYMESAKFPKSSFKGKIVNLDKINFETEGTYTADVTGDITIHGVTKTITTTGTITVKDGKFKAESNFLLKPEDFNIKIPNLVKNNIAKEIKVTVVNNYEPFNK
jgi:polyisoprenoid-binding protein YceI